MVKSKNQSQHTSVFTYSFPLWFVLDQSWQRVNGHGLQPLSHQPETSVSALSVTQEPEVLSPSHQVNEVPTILMMHSFLLLTYKHGLE